MRAFREYIDLVSVQLRSMRTDVPLIVAIQVALSVGLVVGMGYLMPNVSDATAMYLVTGAATQTFITIGLVMLPQMLAESREQGRMEYFLTMPISRELYLLSLLTVVAITTLPAVAFCLAIGALNYGISFHIEPAFFAVTLLAVLSLAGVGVAMVVFAPNWRVVNVLTQLIIFYALFFSPVMLPSSQLPDVLAATARLAPPTYAADGVRATITDLPGTALTRDLVFMSAFAAASLTLSARAIRRRG